MSKFKPGDLAEILHPGDLQGVLEAGQRVKVIQAKGEVAWVEVVGLHYTLPLRNLITMEDSRHIQAVCRMFACVGDPVRALNIWDFLTTCKDTDAFPQNLMNPYPIFSNFTLSEARKAIQQFDSVLHQLELNHEPV